MKFNAVYLAKNAEDLKRLEDSLILLRDHSYISSYEDKPLDIFCTYDNFSVVIAPIKDELPKMSHSSRSHNDGKDLPIQVVHNHLGGSYNVSFDIDRGDIWLNFDINYKPLKDITHFLQLSKRRLK